MNSIRLTRSGTMALAAAVACAITGRLFGLVEGFVAAAVISLVVALAAVAARRRPFDIEVERRARPGRVSIDSSCRVDLTLRNVSRVGTGVVMVTDRVGTDRHAQLQLAPLAGGASRQMLYRLPVHRRGIVTIGPLELQTGDPFGLWCRRRVDPGTAQVIVLPRIIPLAPLPAAPGDDPDSGGLRHRAPANATDDFSTLREYLPGDDVRRVHWPSTARRGHPMVRQYDEPWQRRVTVVADLRSTHHDSESFERAMSATASVLESCAHSDQLVRLVTTSGDDTGFVSSRQGIDAAIDLLAGAEPSTSGSLVGIHRSLIVRRSGGTFVSVTPSLPDSERSIVAAMGDRFGIAVHISCHDGEPIRGTTDVIFTSDAAFAAQWDAAIGRLSLPGVGARR